MAFAQILEGYSCSKSPRAGSPLPPPRLYRVKSKIGLTSSYLYGEVKFNLQLMPIVNKVFQNVPEWSTNSYLKRQSRFEKASSGKSAVINLAFLMLVNIHFQKWQLYNCVKGSGTEIKATANQ